MYTYVAIVAPIRYIILLLFVCPLKHVNLLIIYDPLYERNILAGTSSVAYETCENMQSEMYSIFSLVVVTTRNKFVLDCAAAKVTTNI